MTTNMDADDVLIVDVLPAQSTPRVHEKRRKILNVLKERSQDNIQRDIATTPVSSQSKTVVQRENVTPTDNSCTNLAKAVLLKRRLAFCNKERDELRKRFCEVEGHLTDDEKCILTIKEEDAENHKLSFGVGADEADDIMFVPPDDYSPKKKRRKLLTSFLVENPDKKDGDLVVTFSKSADNLPHARENCQICKFVESNVTTTTITCNEAICEKCYCYICDDLAQKCESWKTGENPHCNAYAKNTYWEAKRKQAKRKKKAAIAPILECLSDDEKTEDVLKAASESSKLVDLVHEASVLSYKTDEHNSMTCACDCHKARYLSYCYACERLKGNVKKRVCELVQSAITQGIEKAEVYLKDNKPSMAVITLDAVTTAVFSVDIEKSKEPQYYEVRSLVERLRNIWIEASIANTSMKSLLDKSRERIKKSLDEEDGPYAIQGKDILRNLQELKALDDPQVQKCLNGKCSIHNTLKQKEDVFQIRLDLLNKAKRYKEAINYLLGSEIENCFNSWYSPTVRACDMKTYRQKLLDYLLKTGRFHEATLVSVYPYSRNLPGNIADKKAYYPKTSSKHKRNETKWEVTYSPLNDFMQYESFKGILSAIISGKPNGSSTASGTSEMDRLARAVRMILSGTQNNMALRGEFCFEWYIDLLFKESPTDLKEPIITNVQREAVQKEASQLVKDARNKILQLTNITKCFVVRQYISLPQFVVELILALISELGRRGGYSRSLGYGYYDTPLPLACTKAFFSRGLYWPCVAIFHHPDLKAKMKFKEVEFFVNNVMAQTGVTCLPKESIDGWFNSTSNTFNFDVLFKVTEKMLEEGSAKGQEGVSLRRRAVELSRKLCEHIICSRGKFRNDVKDKLNKVTTVFSAVAQELGMKSIDSELQELEFTNNPSLETLNAIKKSYPREEDWLKKRSTLLDYLLSNSRSYQEACIEIYTEFRLFESLKKALELPQYSQHTWIKYTDLINKKLKNLQLKAQRRETKAVNAATIANSAPLRPSLVHVDSASTGAAFSTATVARGRTAAPSDAGPSATAAVAPSASSATSVSTTASSSAVAFSAVSPVSTAVASCTVPANTAVAPSPRNSGTAAMAPRTYVTTCGPVSTVTASMAGPVSATAASGAVSARAVAASYSRPVIPAATHSRVSIGAVMVHSEGLATSTVATNTNAVHPISASNAVSLGVATLSSNGNLPATSAAKTLITPSASRAGSGTVANTNHVPLINSSNVVSSSGLTASSAGLVRPQTASNNCPMNPVTASSGPACSQAASTNRPASAFTVGLPASIVNAINAGHMKIVLTSNEGRTKAIILPSSSPSPANALPHTAVPNPAAKIGTGCSSVHAPTNGPTITITFPKNTVVSSSTTASASTTSVSSIRALPNSSMPMSVAAHPTQTTSDSNSSRPNSVSSSIRALPNSSMPMSVAAHPTQTTSDSNSSRPNSVSGVVPQPTSNKPPQQVLTSKPSTSTSASTSTLPTMRPSNALPASVQPSNIKPMPTAQPPNDAVAMIEACKDWIATSIVELSFGLFRGKTEPILQQTKNCLKTIHAISPSGFKCTMALVFPKVTHKFLNNTVQVKKRDDLAKWLAQVKKIYCDVNEKAEWSTRFSELCSGTLKRKPQVVRIHRHLKSKMATTPGESDSRLF